MLYPLSYEGRTLMLPRAVGERSSRSTVSAATTRLPTGSGGGHRGRAGSGEQLAGGQEPER